jgi:hypothetical protein
LGPQVKKTPRRRKRIPRTMKRRPRGMTEKALLREFLNVNLDPIHGSIWLTVSRWIK